jgi:prephenate dehydrogenase
LPPIAKLVVVGVGLIGGSLALALRRAGRVKLAVGVGRTRANLDTAVSAGIADRACRLDEDWTDELHDADVVVVAAPVAQYPMLFASMAGALGTRTIVTDAGSTKQDVVAAARAHLGAHLPRFVPAHPIAGSEQAGAGAAFASLFDDRSVIVTPLPETDAGALQAVEALWQACGARVSRLDPAAHDRIFAAVSHLPHFVAATYVAELAGREDAQELLAHAGTGFRDFTRIAAASVEMWRDIALANRDALQRELAACRDALARVEQAVARRDAAAIDELLRTAAATRRAWPARADDATPE